MSAQLARQQQALVAALFDHPAQNAINNLASYADTESARGLKTYQSNGHALAQRALQAAYPVTALLLGADSFAILAQALWHRHPPQHGDVAEWGAALPDFVVPDPQLAALLYLADLARLEWAVHQAHRCADVAADPASFAMLAHTPAAGLSLRWAPGLTVLPSRWPVVSLWHAHAQGTPDAAVAQRLRAELAQPLAQTALVWRVGWRVRVEAIGADQAALLHTLGQAPNLGAAVSAWQGAMPYAPSDAQPGADPSDWPSDAAWTQGLAYAVREQVLVALVPRAACADCGKMSA
ncbi:MAG: DNA-binding domain-containing protein [Rhodoferax sp.]